MNSHPPRRRRRLVWPLFGLVILLVLAGFYLWRTVAQRPHRRTEYLLGTLIEITAYGPRAENGVDRAFAAMREIARQADPRRAGSDLARLNEAAGRGPVKVGRHTLAMLRLAKEWWARTGGAFDVTVAPVVAVWGFQPGGTPHLPPPGQIAAALPLVGAGDLLVDRAAGTAFLRRPGMAADLGGMAKGYAVDQAYAALARAGVKSALINGGASSIRVLGPPPRGRWWRIGIGHPRAGGQQLLAVLLLDPGQAAGTSADNQRFFLADGRRYAHLIDPRTGQPARRAILFSVVAGDAALADILSTACFVQGSTDGLATARAAGAQGLAYTPERSLRHTAGLAVEAGES